MEIALILISLLAIFLFFRGERYRDKAKKLLLLERENKELQEEIVQLKVERGEQQVVLEQQKLLTEEKLFMVKESQEKLTQAFRALSAEALEKSNKSFLDLAKETLSKFQEKAKGDLEKKQQTFEELVKPVKESLTRLDQGMRNMEKERKGDQESLKTQMNAMLQAEKELRSETSTLVRALRTPIVRGRWGEMQLKRVVELAGMVNHCDFYEQESVEGGTIRPDLIVRLPGHKQVIVDAKTPCEAFLDAMQAEDQGIKEQKLKVHARHVRQHVQALGKKSYWQSFQPTPEFVVLFIPSDHFFSSALEYDPTLIEIGVEQGVIIATPTTLIGLLRAIAYGWKQEKLSQHAEEVSHLGHELYKRIVDMSSHWTKVGRGLSNAVEAYNKAVGSLETRVLVSARKFKEMGAAANAIELDELPVIDRVPREIQAAEMKES
ncbi:MAG: DNA recombination protein RmuC [Simkania sp.]|nr:DNA recombination protein RmuC [Simkania sp.]MCB1074288.1 DNA recombination protein RmuC [Simkania sp.]MCB1082869.1 DNA recombination protein RmuC [Simkania sp.]MCP5490596.1 DNA recombination protein RmuC [Chlamydiales bacterium]